MIKPGQTSQTSANQVFIFLIQILTRYRDQRVILRR